jgi:integrase
VTSSAPARVAPASLAGRDEPRLDIGRRTLRKGARERAPDQDELEALWRRLNPAQVNDLPHEVRAVRLSILLAGQRLEPLLGATSAGIDLEAGTLLLMDPGRGTAPRRYLLPLGPLATAGC